ncbi:polysaccharide deacetylase family protein [Shimia sp.]|uniref:polysaccharide deacetylase family protein n=1 Tax=Shimia sp. TaxID=1954381 RepID=UPI00329756D5
MTGYLTSDGSSLTVVMYHYVRPVASSAFPRLKALELDHFLAQTDYLSEHYAMISPDQLRLAIQGRLALPPNACLLTFDDGYSDHYQYVLPALCSRGLSGLFFTPYQSLVEQRMLDVNKVQFVLSNAAEDVDLAAELDDFLHRETTLDVTRLRREHLHANRYDSASVSYFKRLLQHALPCDVRQTATDYLFSKHVSRDQTQFAAELYLNVDQAKEMRDAGMEFGGHGHDHLWHAQTDAASLAQEVAGSVQALTKIGAPVKGGFYCYPFGSHNDLVCDAVRSAGFQIGFTVEPHLTPSTGQDPLRIPRLDTNDLPKARDAVDDPWLLAARPRQDRA